MRALFLLSLACAVVSLLAIFSFSAMTIVPGPGAERERTVWMFCAATFSICWFCLAFWSQPRQRAVLPPPWLRRGWLVFGGVYCLGILLLSVG